MSQAEKEKSKASRQSQQQINLQQPESTIYQIQDFQLQTSRVQHNEQLAMIDNGNFFKVFQNTKRKPCVLKLYLYKYTYII